jgi:hypothetical protein
MTSNRSLLAVALVAVAIGVFVAWQRVPVTLDPGALMLIAALVPFSMWVGAWQIRILAEACGVAANWTQSLLVFNLTAMASVMPLPGGAVRGGAMLHFGGSLGRTGRVFVIDRLLWTAVSAMFAGAAAIGLGYGTLGPVLLLSGLATGLLAVPLMGAAIPGGLALRLSAARALGVVVDIVRLSVAFSAIGQMATLSESAVLAASGALSVVSIVGVKEGIAAAIGAAVGLAPSTTFLAVTANRLVGVTMALSWEGGRRLVISMEGRC